jgi:hypothetical protein
MALILLTGEAIGDLKYVMHDGHEFDGYLISPIDEQEIREMAEDLRTKRITPEHTSCGRISSSRQTAGREMNNE